MTQSANPLQDFWEDLLSSEPERIRAAYADLDAATRKSVLDHLHRMVAEEGWHPLQQASARAALLALESHADHIEG